MIAPALPLVKDKDNVLRFAFRYKAGLFYTVVGAALIFAVQSAPLLAQLIFDLFGVATIVIGIIAIFKRFDLTINLLTRTYCISKGTWPKVKTIQGSLHDLTSITLSTRADQSENSNAYRPVWVISLNFKNWSGPISIFEFYNELYASQKLQYWAKRLGVNPLDLTKEKTPEGLSEESQAHDQMPFRTVEVKKVPEGLEIHSWAGVTTIILPRIRITFLPVLATLMTILFCSGFTFLALFIIFSDPVRRSKDTPVWLLYGISILFLLVSVYVFIGIMKQTWAREIITLDGAGLVHGKKIFGRVWNKRRLRREEIKDISIRKYTGLNRDMEAVAITGEKLLIRAGQSLQQDQREWLFDKIRSYAER